MKVNWDDDIPNKWKNRIHVPNHQLAFIQRVAPNPKYVWLVNLAEVQSIFFGSCPKQLLYHIFPI
jgi:hypothetical protein